MRAMIAVAVLGAALVATASANGSGCENSASGCEVTNSGSSIDISAGVSSRDSTRSSAPASPSQDSPGPPSRLGAAPDSAPAPEDCGPLGCRGNYTVVTIPDLTLEVLASFGPATPSLTGQPTGFGVAGMPANLVAAASVQTIPGTVLDWDVTVRFTPVAFEFDHGDGTVAVHTTGGATWEQLGQPQLTPTATSHVYRARGTYSVAVTVRYEASVDFGTGVWRPVPGFVTATSGGYRVQILEARTALVDQTCVEDPDGPGC